MKKLNAGFLVGLQRAIRRAAKRTRTNDSTIESRAACRGSEAGAAEKNAINSAAAGAKGKTNFPFVGYFDTAPRNLKELI